MSWTVEVARKVEKAKKKLSEDVCSALAALVAEIALSGPVRGNWRNYSKLQGKDGHHHCHLQSGRPTYVACWKVTDAKNKKVEVYYAGTHEKAPY